MEPGQDEVRAAGDGALEGLDGLVASGMQAEVVLRLDALRIEGGGLVLRASRRTFAEFGEKIMLVCYRTVGKSQSCHVNLRAGLGPDRCGLPF